MQINPQLECFLKVAECQSFTLAAEKLHITPTAVSKQVKLFESRLGEQLFVRTTRTVALTEFGELLYQRCKILQQQLFSVEQFIQSKKETPSGKLKVLVSTIMGKQIVLPKLKAFNDKYPEIELELQFSEQDKAVREQEIDVMVGFPQIPPWTDQFKYRKVAEVKNILCASPNYIEQYGCPQTPEDLLQAKFISHTLRSPNYFLPLANGKQLMIAPPVMTMNNFDALNAACLDGIGLFLTGDVLVKTYLDNGELIQVLPEFEFRHYDIYIFYRHYDYEIPKLRAFVDFYS